MAGENVTGPPNLTEARGLSLEGTTFIRSVVGAAVLELAKMSEFRDRILDVSVHPVREGEESRGVDLSMKGIEVRIFGEEADGETHLYLEQTTPRQDIVRQDLGELKLITAANIREVLFGALSNLIEESPGI